MDTILNKTQGTDNLSSKYKVITTANIIDRFTQVGWSVQQVKASKGEFGKHLVRLRHPSLGVLGGEGLFPEVIITNSYDGKSAFKLHLGIFRLVCSNGLIIGDTIYSRRVTHVGDALASCLEAAQSLALQAGSLVNEVNKLQSRTLELTQIAERINRVWDVVKLPGRPVYSTINRIRRNADVGDSAWHVLNRVQENIIQGYARYYVEDEGFTTGSRKLRQSKSISRIVDINRAVWSAFSEVK